MSYPLEYELGLIRADRGEFIDKGNQVYDPHHEDFEGGARGDGSRDDYRAIQACIDYAYARGGGIVRFKPGMTYRTTLGIIAKTSVRLDLNGATLSFQFASGADEYGVQLRDYAAVYGGTITVAALGNPSGASAELHGNVVVGQSGADLAGYKGFYIGHLVCNNNRSTSGTGGTCVTVMASSHDGIIENIECPSSATIGCAVRIRWAGPGGSPPASSEHPYNIAVRNIRLGSMTLAAATDIAAVDIVGAYNVTVDNVACDLWTGDALVQIRPGGFGSTVAAAAIEPLLFRNIEVNNVILKAGAAASAVCIINGKANDAGGTPVYSMPVVLRNAKGVGAGATSTVAGIRLLNVYDAEIINCECEQFDRGLYIEEATRRIRVRGGRYFLNNESGVVVVHSTDPEDITLERVESYANGVDTGSHAGFYVDESARVHFIDCVAGNESGTEDASTGQAYGFRVTSSAIGTRFSGRNRVRAIKSGGTKYLFAAAVYGDRPFSGGSLGVLATGSTEYLPVYGVAAPQATELDASVLVNPDLVLCNLQVKLSAAPNGATKTRTIRVVDDGSVTAMLATATDAETTASYLPAIEVAAGSTLSVQSTVANTPDAARAKWSVEAFLG